MISTLALALAQVLVAAQIASAPVANIALWPDLQNYVTSIDPGDNDDVRAQLLDALVTDTIAQHPAFVIDVGDMTDSTGGLDQQNGAGQLADDPNHQGQPNDVEWQRIRQRAFDRLDAAGIPYFEVVGNHDSWIDHDRYFVNVPGRTLGPPAHWSQLMQTPIGSFCLVGMPFASADQNVEWITGQLGCGALRPTILVSHGGVYPSAALANPLVIQESHGHIVCTGCVMSSQTIFGKIISTFTNWQEVTFGGAGGTNHTGLSWWSLLTIDPVANTSTISARNPYLGGTNDSPVSTDYTNANTTLQLPYNFCASFGGPACPAP